MILSALNKPMQLCISGYSTTPIDGDTIVRKIQNKKLILFMMTTNTFNTICICFCILGVLMYEFICYMF